MPFIEYFYSAHSGYAYIGSAHFMAIAKARGRRIVHKPMDLRRVVATTGPGATNSLTPQRRAYFSGREIQRWAQFRNSPVVTGMPIHHDNEIATSNGMLIAALAQGHDIDQLAHALLQAHWRDHANLANPQTLAELGDAVRLDGRALVDAAHAADVQAQYQANTEEAIRRSVFGSPTYFVDGDMFYGQDHLEVVDRACVQAFAGQWPPLD
jgi:2-hydroxychromene-2-carboxylate isomerase